MQTCALRMCIFGWSSIRQHHVHFSFVRNNCHVHKCYPWCEGTMCDAFDIDDKRTNCCRLDVLQNNFTQFAYGQLCTLELHSGYDLGGIPKVAFLPIVANLVLPTLKHQTQDQLQFHLLMFGQSHQAIIVAIMPFCYNHKMITENKVHENKWSITKYIKIKSCKDFASMSFSHKINFTHK